MACSDSDTIKTICELNDASRIMRKFTDYKSKFDKELRQILRQLLTTPPEQLTFEQLKMCSVVVARASADFPTQEVWKIYQNLNEPLKQKCQLEGISIENLNLELSQIMFA